MVFSSGEVLLKNQELKRPWQTVQNNKLTKLEKQREKEDKMSETEKLKVQIQEKLIESGEYDRISSLLRERLLTSGWFDNIRKLAIDQVSHEEEPNFTKLNSVLEPKALAMVPEDVKAEILQQIKQFLETIIETE